MQGRRLPDNAKPFDGNEWKPGDYARQDATQYEGVTWWFMSPNGHYGRIGTQHTIVTHLDSTITVSPSILLKDGVGELWHGYLENGVWRSC